MQLNLVQGSTFYLKGENADLPLYITSPGHAVLLDGGCPGRDAEDALLMLAKTAMTIDAVLCTHAHPDHMGLCRLLQQRGAVIAMPAWEAVQAESAAHLKACYPLFSPGQIEHYFSDLLFTADVTFSPAQDSIVLGGADFGLRCIPGHTLAQTAVCTPDGIWYVADAMISAEACCRARLPYAFSIQDTLDTLDQMKALPGPVLMAHSGLCQDPAALAEENRALFVGCAAELVGLLTRPMTLEQWLAAFVAKYRLRSGEDTYGLRVLDRNLRSFADYLIDQGRVVQTARAGQMLYEMKEEGTWC